MPETPGTAGSAAREQDPFASIRPTIRRWKLEAALEAISKLSWQAKDKAPTSSPSVRNDLPYWHQHDLAVLARLMLCECTPKRGTQPTANDVAKAAKKVFNAADAHFVAEPPQTGKEGLRRAENALRRIALVQWRTRSSVHRDLGRCLWMFDQLPRQPGLAEKLKLDWRQAVTEACGLEPSDLFLLVLLFVSRYNGGVFTRGNLSTDLSLCGAHRAEERLDAFLCAFARRPAQLVETALRRKRADVAYDYYEMDPFLEFPFVQIDKARFIAPSYRSTLYALTTGVFWKVRNSLSAAVKGQTAADDDLGIIFEQYVRGVAQHYVSASDFVGEIEYDCGRWADLALIAGDMGVVVECKAHGFALEALATGDIPGAKDLDLNILAGLKQLAAKLRDVDRAALKEPRLSRVRCWVPAVVIYAPALPLNTTAMRERILERLEEDERAAVRDHVVMHIEDFERVMMAANALHPAQTIHAVSRHNSEAAPLREMATVSAWLEHESVPSLDTSYFDRAIEEALGSLEV